MKAVVELLRDPAGIARRCHEDDGLREIAIASIASIAIGAGVFGAVLGSFRGEVQIAFSAIKLPLAFLATLALCVPAFHGIAAGLGRPWPLRSVVGLTLAASARASLVLLALAPVLWLAVDFGLDYHASVLTAAALYALGSLAALGVLLRGLGAGSGRVVLASLMVLVFLAIGGQTAWSLRPFFGRPSQDEIPFVRDTEGAFADAIVLSARSMAGVYDSEAPETLRETPEWLHEQHKVPPASYEGEPIRDAWGSP